MSYASKAGRASVNPMAPRAFAVCDRCGIWYQHNQLRWQFDWRGVALQNLRILVCSPCYDTPQPQLKAISVPADPIPIQQPRVEPFIADEAGSATGLPYGPPVGLQQGAIMPLSTASGAPIRYGLPVPFLSITANGTTTITVTCSGPHGLATNGQISVLGLTQAGANGMYSIVVTTATAFTYLVANPVPTGSLIQPHVIMLTCLVGLPYNTQTIPLIGGNV